MRRTCTWLVDYCQRMDISNSMVMGAPASKKMEWDLLQYMDFVGFVRFFLGGGISADKDAFLARVLEGMLPWLLGTNRDAHADDSTLQQSFWGICDWIQAHRNLPSVEITIWWWLGILQLVGQVVRCQDRKWNIIIHGTFRWTWLGIPAANSLVPWPEQRCFFRMWWQKCSYTWCHHYPVHKDSRLLWIQHVLQLFITTILKRSSNSWPSCFTLRNGFISLSLAGP